MQKRGQIFPNNTGSSVHQTLQENKRTQGYCYIDNVISKKKQQNVMQISPKKGVTEWREMCNVKEYGGSRLPFETARVVRLTKCVIFLISLLYSQSISAHCRCPRIQTYTTIFFRLSSDPSSSDVIPTTSLPALTWKRSAFSLALDHESAFSSMDRTVFSCLLMCTTSRTVRLY